MFSLYVILFQKKKYNNNASYLFRSRTKNYVLVCTRAYTRHIDGLFISFNKYEPDFVPLLSSYNLHF